MKSKLALSLVRVFLGSSRTIDCWCPSPRVLLPPRTSVSILVVASAIQHFIRPSFVVSQLWSRLQQSISVTTLTLFAKKLGKCSSVHHRRSFLHSAAYPACLSPAGLSTVSSPCPAAQGKGYIVRSLSGLLKVLFSLSDLRLGAGEQRRDGQYDSLRKAPSWKSTHFPSITSVWVSQVIDFPVRAFTILLLGLVPHSG